MSMSNYEKSAKKKQQELLLKKRTFQQTIDCLKNKKKIVSPKYFDYITDFIADLYDLSIDEVKKAANGDEYWCVLRED